MSAEDMRKVVGLADGCELMSALTRFPDNDVAAAVASGSVHDDAVGCAKDVAAARDDGRAGDIEALCEGFVCAADEDAEALGAALRRAWSLLYARQGSGVAIFPYESAFVHVREGLPGAPALFRTALTLRVEKPCVRAAFCRRTPRPSRATARGTNGRSSRFSLAARRLL